MFSLVSCWTDLKTSELEFSGGCSGKVFLCVLQVDVVCGDHLLDHFQSLKDVQKAVGDEALQVSSTDLKSGNVEDQEY